MFAKKHLEIADSHWAVQLIKSKYKQGIAENDERALSYIAMAYSLNVMNNIEYLLSHSDKEVEMQIRASAYRAFTYLNMMQLPEDRVERMLYILKLMAYRYISGKPAELSNYIKTVNISSADNLEWDEQLLYSIYECWLYIFSFSNLERIPEIIAKLREEQKLKEPAVLRANEPSIALKLVSLYYLAGITELLARNLSDSAELSSEFNILLNLAIKAASYSKDMELRTVMLLLYVVSFFMIQIKEDVNYVQSKNNKER